MSLLFGVSCVKETRILSIVKSRRSFTNKLYEKYCKLSVDCLIKDSLHYLYLRFFKK